MYSITIVGLIISLPLLIIGSDERRRTQDTENKKLLSEQRSEYSSEYGSSDHRMVKLLVAPIKTCNSHFPIDEKQQLKKPKQKNGKTSNGVHTIDDLYSLDYDPKNANHRNGSKHNDFEMVPVEEKKHAPEKKSSKDILPIHARRAARLYKEILENTHLYWNVTKLDLSGANITGIFHLGFLTFEMRNLETLYLDNNSITKLIGGINRHTALQYFSVANNKLEKIALVKVFTCFPNLKNLNIDYNEKVILSSENITKSTQCTISCRNCMLSEKDLKALASNAILKPQTIKGFWTGESRERETPAYKFHNS